ncbi:MAG: transcription antitermination factor NusB [Gammaproteobacteria bacterium]|nr:transcription antitermination factor NusB [Gammaproteobacteria bacterium]
MNTAARPAPNLRHRTRRAAVQALYQWQVTAQTPGSIVSQLLEDGGQGRLDKRFLSELVTGTVAALPVVDEALLPHLDRPIEQVDPVARAILRMGTFELLNKLEIPLRVVLNEAVELAKTFGAEESYRYVNGILDNVAQHHRPEARPPP